MACSWNILRENKCLNVQIILSAPEGTSAPMIQDIPAEDTTLYENIFHDGRGFGSSMDRYREQQHEVNRVVATHHKPPWKVGNRAGRRTTYIASKFDDHTQYLTCGPCWTLLSSSSDFSENSRFLCFLHHPHSKCTEPSWSIPKAT